jgi:hypothetical protein
VSVTVAFANSARGDVSELHPAGKLRTVRWAVSELVKRKVLIYRTYLEYLGKRAFHR